MYNSLTYVQDTDELILMNLNDKELYDTCLINHYNYNLCMNNDILKTRYKTYIVMNQINRIKNIKYKNFKMVFYNITYFDIFIIRRGKVSKIDLIESHKKELEDGLLLLRISLLNTVSGTDVVINIPDISSIVYLIRDNNDLYQFIYNLLYHGASFDIKDINNKIYFQI